MIPRGSVTCRRRDVTRRDDRAMTRATAHALCPLAAAASAGEFEKMLREQRPLKVVGLGSTAAVGSARRALWRLATFPSFESAVTALLIANALLLCTQHAGEPASLVTTRDVAEVRASLLARRSSAVVLFLSSAVLHLLLGRPPRRARPQQTEFEKKAAPRQTAFDHKKSGTKTVRRFVSGWRGPRRRSASRRSMSPRSSSRSSGSATRRSGRTSKTCLRRSARPRR